MQAMALEVQSAAPLPDAANAAPQRRDKPWRQRLSASVVANFLPLAFLVATVAVRRAVHLLGMHVAGRVARSGCCNPSGVA